MKLNSDRNLIWRECNRKEYMAGFLPKDIIYPNNINNLQKTSAKKDIQWLLTKAPHNVDEIADHFAMSPDLVKYLMKELT